MLKELWFFALGGGDQTPDLDKNRVFFVDAIEESDDLTEAERDLLKNIEEEIYQKSDSTKEYGDFWCEILLSDFSDQLVNPVTSADDFYLDLYELSEHLSDSYESIKKEQESFDSPADLGSETLGDLGDFLSDPKTLIAGGIILGLLILGKK